MNDAATPEPSHPCIGCGLCCNGVMFAQVPLAQSEIEQVTAAGLAVHAASDGSPCFDQPCPQFDGGRCSIYAVRPETCRTYRCRTLKAYDAGTIDLDEALRRVETARRAAQRITPLVGVGDSLEKVRLRLAAQAKEGLPPSEPALLLHIGALEVVLARYFREGSSKANPAPSAD